MPLTWGNTVPRGILSKLVCELVTNALRHGGGQITLRLCHTGNRLRTEVHDTGAGRPVRKHPTVHDESGRGLKLIDGLIEPYGGDRGVIDDQTGPGKTVYVTLPLTATPLAPR